MAFRKNVKRIDPRYFLHETVNRGEELEEGIPRKQSDMIKAATQSQGRHRRVTAPDDPWTDYTPDEALAHARGEAPKYGEKEEEELEEGCPHAEEGGEAIDISAPGMEVHVDDISQLSPEEAFAAGMAAARDAIDQVMGGGGPPPEEVEALPPPMEE